MTTLELSAEPRTVLGKKVRFLRRQGLVPANIYGANTESQAIQLSERDVNLRLLRTSRSTPVVLAIDGQTRKVVVKNVQREATTDRVLHVDFQISAAE